MTALQPDARRRRLRSALIVMLSALVLGGILGSLAAKALGSSGPTYEASKVLGVVPTAEGSAEGAMAATKQWAAVGESSAFLQRVGEGLSKNAETASLQVKVTAGEMAQVLSVSATGKNEADATRQVEAVSKELTKVASQTDSRYPLKALTQVGTSQEEGTSGALVGLATFALSLLAGAAVAAFLWRRG